jgi:hypothetical protein
MAMLEIVGEQRKVPGAVVTCSSVRTMSLYSSIVKQKKKEEKQILKLFQIHSLLRFRVFLPDI